ncbi:uncharacterized protein LOC113205020 [Frankliniella occidentalis]|uniref:Uncharacterized protein LOC113205020 n=1 Tax=Frankliniella occidentalis TaxID=133901 RepID=A0A6J1SC14_FRAOC|nr:uncharacterized protein LOC113205020 [Frankliniella occidentalis]
MGSSVLTLEQLPDDVLLVAMHFVSVEDVLSCRLVCKRLCGLALHRDIWRHRSVADGKSCTGAVLRLAPCLNKLTVKSRVPTLAVTTTRCAVANLELLPDYELHRDQVPECVLALALSVRNQEALGRLRRLKLVIYLPSADALLRMVASCSHLESLTVIGNRGIRHPVLNGPPVPSLREFQCSLVPSCESFVHTILAGHAATLEDVALSGAHETTTSILLAALPRLHRLRLDDEVRGLEAVAACKTLRDVHITLYEDLDNLGKNAAEFLRRAYRLRRVHLEYSAGSDTGADHCTVLVEALVSSGPSRVEWLSLVRFEDVRPLLRVLPSLPALRRLEVDLGVTEEPDDELLKGITPVTAPALTLLKIVVSGCPHAWVHGDTAQATLAVNPSLHIQFWCRTVRKCDPQGCESCMLGCHREVNWDWGSKVGLYLHDPDKCPSPEDHTEDTDDWESPFIPKTRAVCTWIHL